MVTWHCEAPAKINLSLHVTARRADGYHELESLVVFADVCDRISVSYSEAGDNALPVQLELGGPFGAGLPVGPSNLVMRAALLLLERCPRTDQGMGASGIFIRLEKNLPLASGIGGGSTDAAATLLALSRLLGISDPELPEACAKELGADVPMCLYGRPLIARGTGHDVTPLRGFPSLAMVLVNPLVEVSTPDVFRALQNRFNPGLPDIGPDLLSTLKAMRNDLEIPARGLVSDISQVTDSLERAGSPLLVRMSGSGATCFALYETMEAAQAAALQIAASQPDWWVQAASTTNYQEDFMERPWLE